MVLARRGRCLLGPGDETGGTFATDDRNRPGNGGRNGQLSRIRDASNQSVPGMLLAPRPKWVGGPRGERIGMKKRLELLGTDAGQSAARDHRLA